MRSLRILALTRHPPHDGFAPEIHHEKTRDGDQNCERKMPRHRDTSLADLTPSWPPDGIRTDVDTGSAWGHRRRLIPIAKNCFRVLAANPAAKKQRKRAAVPRRRSSIPSRPRPSIPVLPGRPFRPPRSSRLGPTGSERSRDCGDASIARGCGPRGGVGIMHRITRVLPSAVMRWSASGGTCITCPQFKPDRR